MDGGDPGGFVWFGLRLTAAVVRWRHWRSILGGEVWRWESYRIDVRIEETRCNGEGAGLAF